MRSVGWIIWNTKTQTRGKTGPGGYTWRRTKGTTKVYRSEKVCKNYCREDEEPREVFIND